MASSPVAALSAAPAGWLRLCPARYLWADESARNAYRALVLSARASHLSGSLDELEQAVIRIEQSDSMEAAANALRADDIALPGAIRWARRRITLVQDALMSVMHALPGCFAICQPSVTAFRCYLTGTHVLLRLREMAALRLQTVPSPVGFAPTPGRKRRHVIQHERGPDPPVCRQ
jgi:hypothetical protein